MRKKGIEPEQEQAKDFVRDYLIRNEWHGAARLSKETGVPISTLCYWLNGRTDNLKTPAYFEAIQKWIKEHQS